MRKVAIVGGGLAKFGIRNATWKELAQEAGKAVFDDVKNLAPKDIDSLFVGAAQPERFAFQTHVAPMAAEQLGIFPTKVVARTELACASGQAAIRYAWACIASGLSEIALCVGVEKMNIPNMAEAQTSMANVLDREWDGVHGASAPPYFAMCAQRHMKEYGTTREQLALVSVKNHHFSTTNPFAQFQKEFTVEKVISGPVVAPPLTLFDCCGITDGAAAVILTSAERAKEFTDTPMYILGSGQSTIGNLVTNLKSLTTWEPLKVAAEEAFKSAKITVDDIDLAELHDCFTISEIIEYEDFGFCEKGEGGKFIEEGQSNIGGKVAVNTRGGLLGTGHPLGATGIAQAIELLQQFRGDVPKGRYVKGAELGLTHNLSGAANMHSVMIYGRG
ncbi:MAG: thiolase domain-containing protein [Candidatus Thermoplasmatota archaeon]|nr:thiolase domain-containing protein [Candidatus Thermoplasmatota archaeon]